MSIVVLAVILLLFIPFMAYPYSYYPYTFSMLFLPIGLLSLFMIPGLIFTILWFNWRHEPSQHKTGLIVTGVISLVLGGFVPGILVIIGGAIAPEPSELAVKAARRPIPLKASTRCPVCGGRIELGDRYCASCGASLAHQSPQ